jgi:hypothetical protein
MPDRPIAPFEDDIEFLAAGEIPWARARSKRIGVQRELHQAEDEILPLRGVVGTARTPKPDELRRYFAIIQHEEDGLRRDIDARLALNRSGGPTLGLDALCAEYGLGVFERTLLLLAVLPALGEDIFSVLDPATARGYMGSLLCPEHIWQYLEMNVEERIKSRLALLPTAPLLGAGLITLDIGRSASPASIADARIEITSAAFAKIVSIPELARTESEKSDG